MQLADHIRKARQIQNKLSHPSCAAVIVAAGSSARMGGTDKILAELGGLPVLSRTLRVFDDHDMIDTIIVVAREEQMPKISRVCSPYHKVRIVVPGGNSRQESVMHGLEAVPEGTELVAIHVIARSEPDRQPQDRGQIHALHHKRARQTAAMPGEHERHADDQTDHGQRELQTPERVVRPPLFEPVLDAIIVVRHLAPPIF